MSPAARVVGEQLLAEAARRGWLGLWLTVERFPLFRWPRLPLWLGRLLAAPAIVDRLWDGMASGLSFAKLRVRDAVRGNPRRG
jgi:hypothetical protein